MDLKELKEKLRKYKKEDIIITEHAKIQAYTREVDLEEVKSNILNPERLVHAKEEEPKKPDEEKYDCYFAYSEELCHRYLIVLNRKLLIVTIIKINRNWQKTIER